MQLPMTLRERLDAAERPLVGLWNDSASPLAAEILAGSGADMVLFDGEHGPIGIESIVSLLQAAAPYPATSIVRVPWNDPVLIKQFLDAGAQNLIVPMVGSAAEAAAAVSAMRYPPRGVRGIGAALARSSRWGRVPDYVQRAHELVSCVVQIETADGARNAAEIAAVDGVDAVFVGPADLAGSLGFPGAEAMSAAVLDTIATVRDTGTFVGVNAFVEADADRYLAAGADFVFVGADVSILARGAEAAVRRLAPPASSAADTY